MEIRTRAENDLPGSMISALDLGDADKAALLWARLCEPTTDLGPNVQDQLKLLYWGGHVFADHLPFVQLLEKVLEKAREVETARLTDQVITTLVTLGSAAIREHEHIVARLHSKEAKVQWRLAMLLSRAEDKNIARDAIAQLKLLASDAPRNMVALNTLIEDAVERGDLTTEELYRSRKYFLSKSPIDGGAFMNLLLRREKMQQAFVVSQTLAFKQFDVPDELRAEFSELYELLVDRLDSSELTEDEQLIRLRSVVDCLLSRIPTLPNDTFRELSHQRPTILRLALVRMRAGRIFEQRSVQLNPNDAGRRDSHLFREQAPILYELADSLLIETAERQLANLDVTALLAHTASMPPVLELFLARGDVRSFSRLYVTLQKLHGRSEWLHKFKNIQQFLVERRDEDFVAYRLVNADDFMKAHCGAPNYSYLRPAIKGTHEANIDGETRTLPYTSMEWQLNLYQTPLSLIDQDLVVIKNHVLDPGKFFYRNYPRTSASFITKVGDRAVFSQAIPTRTIAEPVVVLLNNDCSYTANYYHQLVLVAARIVWLAEYGHLDGRRLVMPAAIPAYLLELLELAGIAREGMLFAGEGERIEFSDALFVSAIEMACEDALRLLRQRAWTGAGVDENATPERKLLILRRGTDQRRSFREPELVDLSEGIGFEEVMPETMSLVEQVRCFSNASTIVALAGASLTNLIFARDGVSVVGITKDAVYSPTFVEIALALGQKYRWLLGTNVSVDYLWGFVATSYDLDVTEIEDALSWAQENQLGGDKSPGDNPDV